MTFCSLFKPCFFCRSLVSSVRRRVPEKYIEKRNSPKITQSPLNVDKVNTTVLSSQDILEKHITGLSTDIYQKNRVYKNDLLRVLAKVKEFNFSKKKQALLLIRCCGDLLPDETPLGRMQLVEEVWNTLK